MTTFSYSVMEAPDYEEDCKDPAKMMMVLRYLDAIPEKTSWWKSIDVAYTLMASVKYLGNNKELMRQVLSALLKLDWDYIVANAPISGKGTVNALRRLFEHDPTLKHDLDRLECMV